MSQLLPLFWSFCKIGFTSFGGLSMVPLINSEMASHQWMTASEISDIIAIAEMTPGPLGINCATFAGMRVAGVLGALVSTLGVLSPTLTICAICAVFFERFKESPILGKIMLGVRPVCIGLIWSVIIQLFGTNYMLGTQLLWPNLLIAAAALYLLIGRKMSIPKVILLAAMAGIVLVR